MAKKKNTERSKVEDELSTLEQSELNFEQTLADVESIVGQLESGSLGLSESLERYEAGIRQLKRCHQLLDAAEQRVSILAGFDADGNPISESFSSESSGRGSGRKANAEVHASSDEASTDRASGSPDGGEQLF